MASGLFTKFIYRVVKVIKDPISKFTFVDKMLILMIFLITIISYGFNLSANKNSTEKIVTLKQGDKTLLQFPIGNGVNDGIHYFDFDKGVGAIEVKDSKVRMLPMDKSICPEAICSKTGWIDSGLKSIICLPNRLIAHIRDDENSEVDGVAS